jgi:hypothetical protein
MGRARVGVDKTDVVESSAGRIMILSNLQIKEKGTLQ